MLALGWIVFVKSTFKDTDNIKVRHPVIVKEIVKILLICGIESYKINTLSFKSRAGQTTGNKPGNSC